MFTVLWFVLAGDPLHSWPFGLVTVGIAFLLSLRILPPADRLVAPFPGVFVLAANLVVQSFIAGTDVAFRALAPSRPINPGMIEYRLRNRHRVLPVLLGLIITMLPGTLAVRSRGGVLLIHVINRSASVERDIERMERRLARLLLRTPKTE